MSDKEIVDLSSNTSIGNIDAVITKTKESEASKIKENTSEDLEITTLKDINFEKDIVELSNVFNINAHDTNSSNIPYRQLNILPACQTSSNLTLQSSTEPSLLLTTQPSIQHFTNFTSTLFQLQNKGVLKLISYQRSKQNSLLASPLYLLQYIHSIHSLSKHFKELEMPSLNRADKIYLKLPILDNSSPQPKNAFQILPLVAKSYSISYQHCKIVKTIKNRKQDHSSSDFNKSNNSKLNSLLLPSLFPSTYTLVKNVLNITTKNATKSMSKKTLVKKNSFTT